MLLILLLGNHREYTQLLSGLHMRSSQRFLPRLSRIGRDEKSSSQSSDLGTEVEGGLAGGAMLVGESAVRALGAASASAVSALQHTCRPLPSPCCNLPVCLRLPNLQ